MKKDFLFLCAVSLFSLAVVVWPLPYPTADSEEYSEDAGMVTVSRGMSAQQIQLSPSRTATGIVFWIAGEPAIKSDTFVELFVDDIRSANAVDDFSQAKRFSEVYNQENRTLRFSFSKIDTRDTSYRVSLRIPDASEEESFGIRGAVQTIERRSLLSIFYTKLYLAKTEGEDIYYYWVRGGQVVSGGNPYECALDDTCIQHKNPGHFPLFYWLSSFSIRAGFDDFEDWIAFWRPIFLLCYIAT
ncbi:MAG: hypothetical protein AAB649_07175, partial [Patescibacteria group bacterium]